MYFHAIACQVFQRELSAIAAKSEHSISITWLPQGLHETPQILCRRLEETMDAVLKDIDAGHIKHTPDAFLLCYGLCSNGTIGLHATRIPIVIPKVDDCIALFLGSEKRYLKLFNEMSGTYWLNNGWIETSFLPTEEEQKKRHARYTEKYGKENADYLMEQETIFLKNYRYCGYIESPVYKSSEHLNLAKKFSDQWKLKFFLENGDLSLIKKLISGNWNSDEFLICEPGQTTAADYSGQKLKTIPTPNH